MLIDNQFEEEIMEPSLPQEGDDAEEETSEGGDLPLHPDVDEADFSGGMTDEDAEDNDVRDHLNAEAIEYSGCVEDVLSLASSVASSYAKRGTGDVPDPDDVVAALRMWLDPQTVPRFNRTLMTDLIAADHLGMWKILSREYAWGAAALACAAGALSAGE